MDPLEQLKQENVQLKMELAAQKAAWQKLNQEKQQTYSILRDSEEQIRKLQEDLALREQMFQEYKEASENEISSLKRLNRDLKQQLQAQLDIESGSDKSGDDVDERFSMSQLPNLTATQMVEALDDWDGVDNTLAVFQDLMIAESDSAKWKPGNPWNSKWKLSVNLYISAAADVNDVSEVFIKECLSELNDKCRENGCFLTPVHVGPKTLTKAQVEPVNVKSFSTWLIEQSDIFVCILKDDIDILSKSEVENGFLNSPSSRNALFLFLPQESKKSGVSKTQMFKLRERIKKCNTEENNVIIECGHNFNFGIEELKNRIHQILKKKFDVLEQLKTDNADISFERISLFEDMKTECDQRAIYERFLANTAPLDATNVVYDYLNDYVKEESRLKNVCLLVGQPGIGKSTILANCIKQWTDSGDAFVLYHFVKFIGSTSAEVSVLYRRLLQQMQFLCKDNSPLPKRPRKLADMFFSLLEKVSANSMKKTVIVLDNIDLIKEHEQFFRWIVNSLPSGVRVIASVGEESCLESWKCLPSPPVPTLLSSDAAELITGVQQLMKSSVLTDDQIQMLCLFAQSSPLWCNLAVKHLIYSIQGSDLDSEAVDTLVESYAECEGITELLRHIFEEIEEKFSEYAVHIFKVLQVIYWSRNGLSLNEIALEISLSYCEISFILYELLRRDILFFCGGLYYIPNIQVQDAMQSLLCRDSMCDYMLLWTPSLVNIFTSETSLMSRRVEELLWVLNRAELKEELYYAIVNFDIFIYMFASCRVGELVSYWKFLSSNEESLVSHYCRALKYMETDDNENPDQSYLISLYWTFGKIIKGLGFLEEALVLLQYSLRLCESFTDPDSLKVAWIMSDLGSLNFLTGRYESAEGYYGEAIRVYESIYKDDSPQFLKILEEFKEVVLKQNKHSVAESLSARIFAIKQNENVIPNTNSVLLNIISHLESQIHEGSIEGSELAKRRNELGVIQAAIGDFKHAEKNLLEAVNLLEENAVMLQVVHNLCKLYTNDGRYDLASALLEKAYEIIKKCDLGSKLEFEVMEKLSFVYRKQGLTALAIPVQRTVLQHLRESRDDMHIDIAEALNNLAVLFCQQGDFASSLPLFEESVKVYTLNLGASHPIVTSTLNNFKIASDKCEY